MSCHLGLARKGRWGPKTVHITYIGLFGSLNFRDWLDWVEGHNFGVEGLGLWAGRIWVLWCGSLRV